MTRASVSRSTCLVVGFVALVYASLAAMAAGCALSHVDAAGGHAHHGSHETSPHNALCAWACQATSDAGLAPEPPAMAMASTAQPTVSAVNQVIPFHLSALLHPRAPPGFPFLIG